MNTPAPSSLDQILAEARRHLPFGEAASPGFETRLRAMLAERSRRSDLADCLASLSWRFAGPFLPLAFAGALLLFVRHQHSLPDGFGGIVTRWADLLPFAF